jgi:hypothetical protein
MIECEDWNVILALSNAIASLGLGAAADIEVVFWPGRG